MSPRELGWLRAGAWHLHLAAGSIPSFVFPLLPSIGGKQHSPGRAGARGRRARCSPNPAGSAGLPRTPPGAGVGTGPPPNPGLIPESRSRAGGR